MQTYNIDAKNKKTLNLSEVKKASKTKIKKAKKIKTASYKRAVKSAKAIINDKKINVDTNRQEQFLKDISPFLTKKGVIKKRLSIKKREEFNKIIAEYTKHGVSTKARIKRQTKKASSTAIERGIADTEKEYKKIQSVFMYPAVKSAIKNNYISSDTIVTLMRTSDSISAKDMHNAMLHLINQIENVPAEARGFVDQDDAYKILYEALMNTNENIEEIPFT